MTDEQIIKALECCKRPVQMCDDCPMGRGYMCFDFLKDYAFDLIKRQKAEIDRFADIGKMHSEVRSDAIREFAERLKRKSYITKPYAFLAPENTKFELVDVCDIDTLVKEMTEKRYE